MCESALIAYLKAPGVKYSTAINDQLHNYGFFLLPEYDR